MAFRHDLALRTGAALELLPELQRALKALGHELHVAEETVVARAETPAGKLQLSLTFVPPGGGLLRAQAEVATFRAPPPTALRAVLRDWNGVAEHLRALTVPASDHVKVWLRAELAPHTELAPPFEPQQLEGLFGAFAQAKLDLERILATLSG